MDIAVLMDELESIKPYKDTTFALMLAAQALGHRVMVFGQRDWRCRLMCARCNSMIRTRIISAC